MNMKCILWRARFIKLIEELDNAPSYNTLKLHLAAASKDKQFKSFIDSDLRVDEESSAAFERRYVLYFRKPMARAANSKVRGMAVSFPSRPERPIINLVINHGDVDANTFTDQTSSDMLARSVALYINN